MPLKEKRGKMLFGKNINKYYLKYAVYIIFGVIALIFVDVYQLKMPEIIGGLVSNIKDKTLTLELVNEYIKQMIIIVLVMFIGRFTWRICIFGNGVRVQTDMRSELFKKAEVLSQLYFLDNILDLTFQLF